LSSSESHTGAIVADRPRVLPRHQKCARTAKPARTDRVKTSH
jgi:hypothetical protein